MPQEEKKMKSLIFPSFAAGRGAVGLLIVRVVVGAALVQHGWPKIQKPIGWMGSESPVPRILQAAAALSDLRGWLVDRAGGGRCGAGAARLAEDPEADWVDGFGIAGARHPSSRRGIIRSARLAC